MYSILTIWYPKSGEVFKNLTGLFETYEEAYREVSEQINSNDRHSMKNTSIRIGWGLTYKIVKVNFVSEKEVFALK